VALLIQQDGLNMFCVSLILSLFLLIAAPPLVPYELERMQRCIRNNAHMQKLGIPVLNQLFAHTTISLEKQRRQDTENSGSEYNGEDDVDSDSHLSDDGLEPLNFLSKVLVIP
jgi:hypothetical protein